MTLRPSRALRHRTPALFASAALLLGLLGVACSDDAQFTVRYAPGYVKEGGKVSVFGIFKDGRVNPESWDQVGPAMLASFGSKATCETAYNNDLLANKPSLAAAIDDYARANGVTDDLLDQLAPVAKGDTVMLITIAGHPPHSVDGGAAHQSAPQQQPSMRGGRSGRGGRTMSTGPSGPVSDRSVYEVSASLFSIRLHQSVALVSMSYEGGSVEDALKKFAEKLSASVPGYSCAGWNWDVAVNEEKVRQMIHQEE